MRPNPMARDPRRSAWCSRRLLVAGVVIALGAWPSTARGQPGGLQRAAPSASSSPESAEPGESAVGIVPLSAPTEHGGTAEWMFGAGGAVSVELFHSRGGIRYAAHTVSWSRELTSDRGPGALRGRLAWVIEVMPLLIELAPTRVYALGISPIGLRWNLVPRRRWSAFTELAGGFLGSSGAIPDEAAQFNFTAHWGAGVRVPVRSRQGLVVAYRFQHISNGNRLATNPGVNSHVALAGWSVITR